jgi:hypothetical protein
MLACVKQGKGSTPFGVSRGFINIAEGVAINSMSEQPTSHINNKQGERL